MSDAFAGGLERLVAAFDDDALTVVTVREHPLQVTIERDEASSGAVPLPVGIALGDDAITVELGGWVHRTARSGPGDEDAAALALDLVAAALIGRVEVVRTALGDGRVLGHDVGIAGAHGMIAFDRRTRWRWPWQSVTATRMRNRERVPAGLALGRAGMLPATPWSGTLALPEPSADAAALPIDGELDLHNFSPKEVDPLVRAYIDECLARGVMNLRIVHGKGIGALRRTVQAILSRHPAVLSRRLGGHGEGSWGATIVTLRAPVDAPPSED